ncbi:MAG TPA: Spy/CpxP family protein refolding chaperone [Syntrophorhabdaceae bacterium]|jgi:Spy/CpxP family protein refolding chaperone
MKMQRRFAVIGGIIIIIMVFMGLGIAEVFGAGGAFRCGPHFGPFGGFHRCHGFEGDMPGFVLKGLDKKIEKLNLTPAQKTEYEGLRAHLKENLLAAKEDRLRFREVVRNEMAKGSPDVAALNAMMKKKIEGVSVALQHDLDLFESFYSILDEGQKQQVVAGIRERMAARDKCREEKR